MEKTITTGTEITFKKTKDIFELTKTDTGFNVKAVKFSKNVPTEPYTFQELLDQYESGKITIEGFEEADAPLVRSILTNYIHTTEIETLKADITKLTSEKEAVESVHQKLLTIHDELTLANEELTKANKELTIANSEVAGLNAELTTENKNLKATNEQLNTTIAAMQEQE